MTREQAINYLICRGLTQEQVGDVVRALTYKPRDCANCKHYVVKDTRTNWGSQETTKIYGCECWECEYEPTTKNNLGVEEVTALAEWTEKLTKASEDAYNKGYTDGMKAQAEHEGLCKEEREISKEKAIEILRADSIASYSVEDILSARDMAIKAIKQEPRKGEWLRMSDLSEQEDDRYKCSRCGNVVHHKNKMNLYTFNSWCGRCGSDNGRHINYEVEE